MACVSNRDSVNDVIGTSFDDHADAMSRHRADALVTDTGNRNAVDSEPGRTYADDFSAMRGGIIEANDVRHIQVSLDGCMASSLVFDAGSLISLGLSYRTNRQTVLVLC